MNTFPCFLIDYLLLEPMNKSELDQYLILSHEFNVPQSDRKPFIYDLKFTGMKNFDILFQGINIVTYWLLLKNDSPIYLIHHFNRALLLSSKHFINRTLNSVFIVILGSSLIKMRSWTKSNRKSNRMRYFL